MDLQNTFYFLAIIFMVLGIGLLLAVVVLLFYIRKKVADLHDYVESKIDDVVDIAKRPATKIANLGSAIFGGKRSSSHTSKKR